MELSIREMLSEDIEQVVDYFVLADQAFLAGMGADQNKLPEKTKWVEQLESEIRKPYTEKEFYYIIWLIDDQPVGHTNINNIQFGVSATMHLHLWKNAVRKKGLGIDFLRQSIPEYFKHFELKKLICQPKADNLPPNKMLKKLGFELVDTYDTIPGWINFHQTINEYELSKETLAWKWN